MAINYAESFSAKIDEIFSLASVTGPAVNQDYSWAGVTAVNVYSIPTVALGNYTLTGSARYGTPTELQNVVQTLTLSRDRSFTTTMDKKSNQDTPVMRAGAWLADEIRTQVVPEIDIYSLGVIVANAGTTGTTAITATNAYSAFLDGQVALTNAKAPVGGRVAYISPSFYKNIRLDGSFIQASSVPGGLTLTGSVGQVDGVPLILVPESYLPANCDFVITNPRACVAPIKLTDYTLHENPPGISGWLIEGRVRYDAFVLTNKEPAIYANVSA